MIKPLSDGRISVQDEELSFIIDPDLGARIVSAKIKDQELLLQERKGLLNWGSTFWFAPQSLWNWPPPEAIHRGNYQWEIRRDKLILQSGIDPDFGFRVTKEFRLDSENSGLEITYRMKNEGDSARQLGPWEVTVVPADGLTVFFALGEEPAETNSNLPFEDTGGIGWFRYEHEKMDEWHKSFNNAQEGWIAAIDQHRNIFIKSFDVIPPDQIAPKQGNVEVYVSKEFKYIELENHGAFKLLQPGESADYLVKWHIHPLPDSISIEKPTPALLQFVRECID